MRLRWQELRPHCGQLLRQALQGRAFCNVALDTEHNVTPQAHELMITGGNWPACGGVSASMTFLCAHRNDGLISVSFPSRGDSCGARPEKWPPNLAYNARSRTPETHRYPLLLASSPASHRSTGWGAGLLQEDLLRVRCGLLRGGRGWALSSPGRCRFL